MAGNKKIAVKVENNEGKEEVMELSERATQRIEIKKVPVEKARVKIVGDTPLLVHAWSEKVKKQLLTDMQMSKREKKEKEHERKDPFADFVEAAYWITPMPQVRGLPVEEQVKLFEKAIEDGAKFGFPTIAFKKAAITAIILDIEEPPELSEDVVQVGFPKKPDLRYRPSFRKWSVELEITLIKTGMFTMEDVVNAIDMSGFMNGVGEWRTERDGEFGSYHVYREGE